MSTTPAIAEHNGTRARLRTLDGSTLAVPVLCWSSTGSALILDGSTGRLAQAQDAPGFDGLEYAPDAVEIRDHLDEQHPAEEHRKTCGRCRKEKAAADFQKDRTRPDGLQWRCRPCHAEVMRETRLRRRTR